MKALRPFTLVAAALVCAMPACSGLRHPTVAEDVFREIGPPPRSWKAAIAFYLEPAARVEFFDGVRTRVVTSGDTVAASIGRSPWYRLHLADTLATVLHVTVEYPGAGIATAEYPLTPEWGAFYSIRTSTAGPEIRRYVLGARDFRSYPIPAAARKTPSDSLWIYWGARSRDCWTCPS